MFAGTYFHTLDSKGRVSIPSRYREILQQEGDRQLILTNYDGYILAFAQSQWAKVETKLGERVSFKKLPRAFQRFLTSGVGECPLDRQGRILIPPHLRDYAKLTREVALIGAVTCFEVWDRGAYEAHRAQLEDMINDEVIDELLL
jgi:MraZ protein